jgi:endonuclease G
VYRADGASDGPHPCPLGRPRWWAPPAGGLRWIVRAGYALEHSARDKIALFVCTTVTRDDLDGPAVREERFAPDPALPPGERAELSDYRGSGYSRGHQAPAGDQGLDQARLDETFYLSNMTPQRQRFNGGVWAELERRVRAWTRRYGVVGVITGPVFHDPAEEAPATADGLVPLEAVGSGRVSVPTHYFKVVVATIDGQRRALAFLLPHVDAPQSVADGVVSIDAIEARTGLDLLPELTPREATQLEATPAALWP